MCIHPHPTPTPSNGQIVRLPPARLVSLFSVLHRRELQAHVDYWEHLELLASIPGRDDDPSPSAPAAAMRRAA